MEREDAQPEVAGKRVLMVIAPLDFRDEEYREPREVIEARGGEVTVASALPGEARGVLGMRARVDVTLERARAADFDAVVFVGGGGAARYWDDPAAHALAREAAAQGKVVGAICIAPVILANAGLLRGRRATVWPREEGRLAERGAVCTGNPVEEDGRIITANGPQAARAFGEAVVRALAAAPGGRPGAAAASGAGTASGG